jgi:4-hydroxy-tetrahydrodipicolinate reductase
MPIKVVIAGAAGRMGMRIADLASQDAVFQVAAGIEQSVRSATVKSSFPILSEGEAVQKGDVVIDFTAPEATVKIIEQAVQYKKAYVVGTTGLTEQDHKKIVEWSRVIPIVTSSNMSLGVNAFFDAARRMAATLIGYTVHIQETHHVHKKDAPSGTALQAGALIEKVTGKKVTYESFREGEVIGDHRIIFTGPADRVELFHHAESRDIFAVGALQAAKWVVTQKPGLYGMNDVLGI